MDVSLINKKADLSEGDWVSGIPGLGTVRLKVRSANYRPFRTATSALARRAGKQLGTDEGLADYNIATGEPMAEHLLLDWDGVTDGDKALKFDQAKALAILTADDDFGIGVKFRRGVEWAADTLAERIAETAKVAEGN